MTVKALSVSCSGRTVEVPDRLECPLDLPRRLGSGSRIVVLDYYFDDLV
jgi:hypothetical protein